MNSVVRHRRVRFVLSVFITCALSTAAWAQSAARPGNSQSTSAQTSASQRGGLEIGGNLTEAAAALQTIAGGNTAPTIAGSSALTLNFVNANRTYAKVEGSAVLNLLYGEYADAYQANVTQAVGPSTAPGLLSLLETQGAAVTVDLQKLYLEIFTDSANFSMGREIINFGVGTLFSPIDAFSTPVLTNLNFTRSGSDVFRIDLPFGSMSGAEGVTTISDSLDSLVSAVKVYTNIANTDVAAVGLYRGSSKELIAGLDFQGNLVGSVYGEAVEHLLLDSNRSYFVGMVGGNYSFQNIVIVTLEYEYNGDAVTPGSLPADQLAATRPVFLNRNYLYGSTKYLLNDLMSLDGSLVYDISASSLMATLQFQWNVVQNGDLLFYSRYVGGDIRSGATGVGKMLQYGAQLQVAF